MLRDVLRYRLFRWTYPVIFLATPTVRAQERVPTDSEPADAATEVASMAFWNGKEYYDEGRYREALEQFQKAHALTNDAALLYDIAQSYRKMGQCEPALQNYQRFLLEAPNSSLASQAEKHVSALQATCSESPSTPRSAAVPKENQPTEAERGASLAHPPVAAARSEAEPDNPRHVRRITLGVSLATLATGLATGGVAAGIIIWNHGRFEQWQSIDRDLKRGPSPGESPAQWLVRQQNNDQFGASINHANSGALVLGLGAGALIATSAVLFFSAPAESSSPKRTQNQHAHISWQPATVGYKLTGISVVGCF